MRYPATLIDKLAAEYVLGTLHGPARRRFESLLRDRADVRHAVWSWEQALNGLAGYVTPIEPGRSVWKIIRRRVGRTTSRRAAAPFWLRWSAAALPAAAIIAWIAVMQFQTPVPERMAVFATENASAMWIVKADLDRGLLVIDAIEPPPPATNSSFELWVLPASGIPESMGLLQAASGSYEAPLSVQAIELLGDATTLAISVEPVGGSPSGLPTGPVVYQASLVRL